MMRWEMIGWGTGALLVALLSGCSSCRQEGTAPVIVGDGGSGKGADGVVKKDALSVAAAGMVDPFGRLDGELPKRLKEGYAAVQKKKWGEARTAFGAVVLSAPDYTSARFQLVRAAALDGDLDMAVREYGELLARDYLAYAGKLDKAKDLAPLRASPQWAKVLEIEKTAQAAYAAGLDKGFFFVGRARDGGTPKFDGQTPFRLEQEAYFYDPGSQHYRRLSDTGGRVYAINVSPDRKTLSYLLVDKIMADDHEGALVQPKAGMVDLGTLTAFGPFKLDDNDQVVELGFTTAGEAWWRSNDHAFLIDSTHTALVRSAAAAVNSGPGGVTFADWDTVSHSDADKGAASLAPDGLTITIAGQEKPIRSARPIDISTLSWSPGKKLLAYAGVLDACKVLANTKPNKDDQNELFLWDNDKKVASRIAQAISSFDSLWLDDNHLVYEGGVGRAGKLHIYEIATRNDLALKLRSGGGLYGYPTLRCEPKDEDAPGEDAPDEPDGE